MSLDCPLVGILQCSSVGILQCSSECRVRKNLLQWASIPISESIVTWTKKEDKKDFCEQKRLLRKTWNSKIKKQGLKNHLKRQRTNLWQKMANKNWKQWCRYQFKRYWWKNSNSLLCYKGEPWMFEIFDCKRRRYWSKIGSNDGWHSITFICFYKFIFYYS